MKKVLEPRVIPRRLESDSPNLPIHRVSILEAKHDTSYHVVVLKFWSSPDDEHPIAHVLSIPAAKLLGDLLHAEVDKFLRSGELDQETVSYN